MTPVSPAARCAYPCCQAGGDILPGAPRVAVRVPWLHTDPGPPEPDQYHPGCWAAEQRLAAQRP